MEKKMTKAQAEKQKIVADISEKLKRAQSVVFVDYRGVKVNDDTAMRRECRKAGVEYTVLKNKLVMRALHDMNIKELDGVLEGPTAFAFGMADLIAPAKIVAQSVAQKKLAKILGVWETTVKRWERQKNKPPVYVWELISDARPIDM